LCGGAAAAIPIRPRCRSEATASADQRIRETRLDSAHDDGSIRVCGGEDGEIGSDMHSRRIGHLRFDIEIDPRDELRREQKTFDGELETIWFRPPNGMITRCADDNGVPLLPCSCDLSVSVLVGVVGVLLVPCDRIRLLRRRTCTVVASSLIRSLVIVRARTCQLHACVQSCHSRRLSLRPAGGDTTKRDATRRTDRCIDRPGMESIDRGWVAHARSHLQSRISV
jgi:hypothetical protein